MRKILLFAYFILVAACTPYTLVKKDKVDFKGMSVIPVGSWSQLASGYTIENIPTWTADGTILNSIMFFSGIADGQKLIKGNGKTHFPTFHKDMLPNEVEQLVESTITQLYGASILKQGELKPYKIGAHATAFQFSFKFAGQDEVPRGLLATGIVKNGRLYLMMYQAADLYYYNKDLTNVQRMMSSMNVS